MSTVTVCAPVATSSVGWSVVGGASFGAVLVDSSDASYALATSTGALRTFTANYDTSAIPQTAVIQQVGFSPRLGIGVDSVGDSGSLLFSLAVAAGTVSTNSMSYSWPGIPSTRTEEALFANSNLTAPAGVPLSRNDLNGIDISVVGSASAGDVSLFLFELELTVTWFARSGSVL